MAFIHLQNVSVQIPVFSNNSRSIKNSFLKKQVTLSFDFDTKKMKGTKIKLKNPL